MSLEPNAAARAQLVNTFLLANGISPNAVVVSSFLTSALSLQRRQDLSFALLGVRDTVSPCADDLTASAVIRQQGFSVNYAHRLTPDYSLGVLVSQQNSSGVSSLQDSRVRFINLSLTGKVGKHATVSVGGRHVVTRGTSPYVENAITGNLDVHLLSMYQAFYGLSNKPFQLIPEEQLRQCVDATCYDRPLDMGETRAYIQDQLNSAGSSGRRVLQRRGWLR